MLLAKKQRTQDLPSEGLSKNIPERSPDTPYSVCKSIEAVTTIEKPTTVTPCKGVPLARGAVPEDTSQSMLRLNKEPPKPLAVPKTSGQGPPEKLSAVGTFKSSAAGQPPCVPFSDGVRLLGQEVQLCKNAGLDATLYSVLAGDVISESHAITFTSTIGGEPVDEQALQAVQRLFGSLTAGHTADLTNRPHSSRQVRLEHWSHLFHQWCPISSRTTLA